MSSPDGADPRCPICDNRIPAAPPPGRPEPSEVRAFLPFCSERCKAIDLHAWLGGSYQLPHLLEEEDLEELG